MVGPDAVLVLGRSAFHDVVSAIVNILAMPCRPALRKQFVCQAHRFPKLHDTNFQLLCFMAGTDIIR